MNGGTSLGPGAYNPYHKSFGYASIRRANTASFAAGARREGVLVNHKNVNSLLKNILNFTIA